jgi:hypothetical protein
MNNVTAFAQPVASPAAPPLRLPDVNAEIYPYEVVQHLLDQTASFNMFAVPDPGFAEAGSLTPSDPDDWFGLNGGYGIAFRSRLRRFNAFVEPPSEGRVAVSQVVGEETGLIECRCLFSADNFRWAPDQNPAPAIFDPWVSQRFAVQEAQLRFGDREGFRGYGIGRTYPVAAEGRPRLLAAAVGNLMEGFGKFRGLEATFVMTGTITNLGFLGNVTCRVVDPQGKLRRDREIGALSSVADPAPEDTFFVLRGVKQDRTVKTTYGPPPDAELVSLVTPSQMRSVDFRCTGSEHGGPYAEMSVGPVVGPMEATVFFNLLAPPGTAERPVPFTTQELYTFEDGKGRTAATLTAGIVEGVSFRLELPAAPGQPGVRFAGFGPITGGTGALAGAQGILTVNSLIGISPHALSLVHTLHVVDPRGKLRTGGAR